MNARLHPPLTWPAAAAPAAARTRPRALDGLLCGLLFVYLATLALEGPLRWALALAGLPDLLYLRDAIPVGSLAFLLLRGALADGRVDLPIAGVIAVLLIHAALAAMLGVELFAILFGLKIFMFIPYGMAMWPLVRQRLPAAAKALALLYGATLAGVLLNGLVGRLPWEAFEYDTAFGAMSTTREWWTIGGAARLPGFARTSFNAASVLGTTGLLLMVAVRSGTLRAALAAATLVAVVFTTTKGVVGAFSVAALWLLLQARIGRAAGLGRALVWAAAVGTLVLPLVVVGLQLGSGSAGASLPDLAQSAWERFSGMWPTAFALLPDGWGVLFGGGLGSIGTPQLYSSAAHHFNAGDNLAVYLIVAFGPAAALYYALPAIGATRLRGPLPPLLQQACIALVLLLYAYGGVSNLVEDSFCTLMLGLAMGLAWSPEAQRARREAVRAARLRREPT